MNTKICTSIEQSKKLLELGLDPSTADMFYPWYIADEEDTFEDGYLLDTPVIGKHGGRGTVPCWSLTALLELMPCPIILNGNFAYPIVNLFSKSITYDVGMAEYHREEGYNLIDAAVKTVVWLIEQKHIKVNK